MLNSARFAPTPIQRSAVAMRRSRWKPLLALLAAGIALYLYLTGDDGLLHLRQRQQERLELAVQVVRLEMENDSLRQVLIRLEDDLEYVEKVAREEYGMTKKGEQIYRLRESAAGEEDR